MANATPKSSCLRRLFVAAATVVVVSASSACALSSPATCGDTVAAGGTALGYMTHQDSYVDSDRTSLSALLQPAALKESQEAPSGSMTTVSRESRRTSPVTELRSVGDYQRHVLDATNQLSVIRFSSPSCKLCRKTQMSWERMAGKIGRSAGGRIRFLSVSVDGSDRGTTALKDLLRVERVPSGILHHPAEGIRGSRLDLDRTSLTALRKRLERYVEEGARGGLLLDVPEFQL